jgi:hypothetical protein
MPTYKIDLEVDNQGRIKKAKKTGGNDKNEDPMKITDTAAVVVGEPFDCSDPAPMVHHQNVYIWAAGRWWCIPV